MRDAHSEFRNCIMEEATKVKDLEAKVTALEGTLEHTVTDKVKASSRASN